MNNDLDLHNLGNVIKTAREAQGLTRDQFAEKIGIGYRHLMGIENGRKTPSFDTLSRLIKALGVSADTIFYPEKDIAVSNKDRLLRVLSLCTEQEIKAVLIMLDILHEKQK